MKFALLPIGAGFRHRGRDYRKVSPLEGIEDATDTRKLVPRSTDVEPTDHHAPRPAQGAFDQGSREAIESALRGCIRKMEQRSRSIHPPLSDDQMTAILKMVHEAHADAMAQLTVGSDAGDERETTRDTGRKDSPTTKPSTKGADIP